MWEALCEGGGHTCGKAHVGLCRRMRAVQGQGAGGSWEAGEQAPGEGEPEAGGMGPRSLKAGVGAAQVGLGGQAESWAAHTGERPLEIHQGGMMGDPVRDGDQRRCQERGYEE